MGRCCRPAVNGCNERQGITQLLWQYCTAYVIAFASNLMHHIQYLHCSQYTAVLELNAMLHLFSFVMCKISVLKHVTHMHLMRNVSTIQLHTACVVLLWQQSTGNCDTSRSLWMGACQCCNTFSLLENWLQICYILASVTPTNEGVHLMTIRMGRMFCNSDHGGDSNCSYSTSRLCQLGSAAQCNAQVTSTCTYHNNKIPLTV